MIEEKKKLKIRTLSGRIITLTVLQELPHGYHGTDLFGKEVIISHSDIDSAHEIGVSKNDSE